MMTSTALTSAPEEIRRDLVFMTRRWHELPMPVRFEIRAFKEGAQPQTATFKQDWIDDAVEWAANMAALGFNCYAVRNPIRDDVVGSASDADIVAAFYLWADCDDSTATNNIRRFDGPKYTAIVRTGTEPTPRVHIYWELDEPCFDLTAWRDMQMRIAQHFQSDRAVINPSRIMRIAGTVTFPAKKKRERGYINEMTALRTDFDTPRQPVSMEQMGRVFATVQNSVPAPAQGGAQPQAGFTIDAGPQPLDRERARIQALSGEAWHDAVIRLVASYVSRGMADDEIHTLTDPLTLDGYTVEETRREVQTAINGARRKGWTPDAAPAKTFDPVPQGDDDAPLQWPTPLSDFDESALPVRQWVYGFDYIRGYVSVVASAGGVGKTSQAVVEALSIVTGRPLLQTAVKEQTNVWVINLEDPRDEIVMRSLAAMKHYNVKPDDVRGKLFLDGEDTIQMTLAMESRDGVQINEDLIDRLRAKIIENRIGVVIIDPFISTHLVNENSNASIQAVVALFRALARETGAAICLVHHIRKGNGEEATVDAVRGAGSLIGAARAVRVINRISERTAIELGIRPAEAKGIFRVDDGKANLAPPADKAVYRQMIGVQIDNGEWIGVAVPFVLPDEWAGMDEKTVNLILAKISLGPDENPDTEDFFSLRPQDKSRWVGNVLTTWMFDDANHVKTPAQAKTIIKTWLENGLLEEVTYFSASQRKDRKGVAVCGYVGGAK